jgi:hypothetical protein
MYGLVANVISDNALRNGALVHLFYRKDGEPRVFVSGLSKGGRRIEKWIPYKRLKNYRAKSLSEYVQERTNLYFMSEDKKELTNIANKYNQVWGDVRFYHRNGELLKEGRLESEAWAEFIECDEIY